MQSSLFFSSAKAMRQREAQNKPEAVMKRAVAEHHAATTSLRDAIRRLNESCEQDKQMETEAPHAAQAGR